MTCRLAICLMAGAIGLAYAYAQTEKLEQTDSANRIAALQQKRIDLLEKRVSQVEVLAEHGLVDSFARIRPQMDLINAKLDYTQANDEKRKLLKELLTKYDALIEMAEVAVSAPRVPPQPGRPPGVELSPSTDMLWLQAERVRVQIMHDELD